MVKNKTQSQSSGEVELGFFFFFFLIHKWGKDTVPRKRNACQVQLLQITPDLVCLDLNRLMFLEAWPGPRARTSIKAKLQLLPLTMQASGVSEVRAGM